MKPYFKPFLAILTALVIIICFALWINKNVPNSQPFDTTAHLKDSILIAQQKTIIETAQIKIDSLTKLKQKTVTIIKEVPKIIKEWQFHETQSAMFSIFDTVELLPRETDTLFCLSHTQAKQCVTTDTLLKLHIVALEQSDSIIDLQGLQLTAKDSIIDATLRGSERYKTAYENAFASYEKARRNGRIGWFANILSFGLGVLVGR
jgi:hypothetical protein